MKKKQTQTELMAEQGNSIVFENNSTLAAEMPRFNSSSLTAVGVRKRHVPQWVLAWIVLVPALIFLVLFMLYPILNTFIIAFFTNFRWVDGAGSFSVGNLIRAWEIGTAVFDPEKGQMITYVLPYFGIDNFVKVLTDPIFPLALLNTLIFVVITVPLTIIIALLISVGLNSIKVLRGFFQTIFFLPYVTNTIALGMVFNTLFNTLNAGGLINTMLQADIPWLDDKVLAGVVITIYSVWNGLAFKILVFMGGLATIDRQYYDAARIDGARGGTIFRRITVPLLSPQILYIMITSFIGGFKAFTGVRAVFADSDFTYFGGPTGTMWITVVGWIYKDIHMGEGATMPGAAAAGSLILLAIILVITAVQFAVSNRRVHY